MPSESNTNQTSFTSIRLQNFRSYDDFVAELTDGVNIVVGPNACGKTNLLESFIVAGGFKSYRAEFSDLIKTGADWFRLDAQCGDDTRVIKVSTNQYGKIKKQYELSGKIKTRLSYQDIIPIVLFEPNHMQLLTGPPDVRRGFIDGILAKTDIEYAKQLATLKRTLTQRNKLLKNGHKSSMDEIFAWNVQLTRAAGYIVSARTKLLGVINETFSHIYSEVAGHTTSVIISYKSSINTSNYESAYMQKLEQSYERDVLRGFTGSGPHRDDIEITIRDVRADQTASRGETRTMVLALKLLEMEIIESARGQKPLLLLDDVFSELDGSRRKSLTKYIAAHQTIITTTDADIITKQFAQNSNLITLN